MQMSFYVKTNLLFKYITVVRMRFIHILKRKKLFLCLIPIFILFYDFEQSTKSQIEIDLPINRSIKVLFKVIFSLVFSSFYIFK